MVGACKEQIIHDLKENPKSKYKENLFGVYDSKKR